ncbi:MAG TPA: phage holin family protein [Thermoanaerobaculia bacterium]|nr:phage holin family protein [Thermoanaerobaculia bacterium]
MRNGESESDETQRETWSRRLQAFLEAGRRLLSTRATIFREELGAKGAFLARGVIGLVVALAFAGMALLLFTAWIAVLLSALLGSPVWGVLAAFALFAGVAVAAGLVGTKALSRVKPFDFPVTSEEIHKDWSALQSSVKPEPPGPPAPQRETELAQSQALRDDLEARFRAGSE